MKTENVTESAENVKKTDDENLRKQPRESDDPIFLTATEAKMLRRFCLTIKSRCADLWRDRDKMKTNKLHVLKELSFIREESGMIYDTVTDATWRELNEEDSNE
jgi:hypothetical protein